MRTSSFFDSELKRRFDSDVSEASASGAESNRGELVAYFETRILCGGLFDQVAVGISTDNDFPLTEFAGYRPGSVAYHSDDGKVYLNGKALEIPVPRFGTNDVVGCGVTVHGDVFFTLNQVPLRLIQSNFSGLVYPLVSMRGRFTSVTVHSN